MKNLAIKAVIQKLEYADIQVGEYTENNKLCGYELNTKESILNIKTV